MHSVPEWDTLHNAVAGTFAWGSVSPASGKKPGVNAFPHSITELRPMSPQNFFVLQPLSPLPQGETHACPYD